MPYADDLRQFDEPQSPQGESGSYFPALAPYQQRLMPNAPMVRGPVQSIKDAFTPRRDEQGNPKAASLGDMISAALMVVPGMRGPRGAVMAAEKGAGSGGGRPPTLGDSSSAVRRNRMSPEERRAGFDRMAKEIEDAGGNPPTPRTSRSAGWDRLAEEIKSEEP